MLRRTHVSFVGILKTRQVAAAGLFLTLVLTLLPGAVIRGEEVRASPDTEVHTDGDGVPWEPPADESVPTAASAASVGTRDRGRAVRLKKQDGTIADLTMDQYLWGVVAAEMPASFEPEALKAQACAARTYTVRQQNASKHPDADICGDSSCCQAWIEREDALQRWGDHADEYDARIQDAVTGTDGLGILYHGAPIQALFFSSADTRTVDAVQVWGNSVDYLKSVSSPEGDEVPNYHTEVTLSPEEVRSRVLAQYPAADLSGDPSGWFGEADRGDGTAVASIPVGGITLTGSQVRSLFQLRSASFSVTWDGAAFTFAVTGYGHGVGMSQYGANAMAAQGRDYKEILAWYYTGAEVAALW